MVEYVCFGVDILQHSDVILKLTQIKTMQTNTGRYGDRFN